MTRILCVAGEVSGDQLMAPLVRTLRDRGAETIGVGGDASLAAGLEPIAHLNDFCVGGIAEIITTIPRGVALLRRLKRLAAEVDRVLLVNWPEINMRLLAATQDPRQRVAFIAPPQAWAWRPWRAAALRKVGFLGCLFAFEAEWYRRRGCQAVWFGAPFTSNEPPPMPTVPGVALLPGSRAAYAQRLLPIQLAAMERLLIDRPGYTIHVGRAPNLREPWFEQCLAASTVPVTLWDGAQEALSRATVALAGMGTVTLEAALAGRPYVGMAQVHPLTAWVGRRLIKSRHFSLPNLVLGDAVFPEWLQGECTPGNLAASTRSILDAPASYLAAIDELRQRVAGGVGSGPVLDFLLHGTRAEVSGWT